MNLIFDENKAVCPICTGDIFQVTRTIEGLELKCANPICGEVFPPKPVTQVHHVYVEKERESDPNDLGFPRL